MTEAHVTTDLVLAPTEMQAREIRKAAVISPCGKYRYRLWRQWEWTDRMPVMWIMLNPSTANATIDDPTIRRCIAFSKAWGYGAMWVGNMYAIRSTDPGILSEVSADEARGPDNLKHLDAMAQESALIVCAWGAPGGYRMPYTLATPGGTWCLGRTKAGAPRHPLYIAGVTPLQEFAS